MQLQARRLVWINPRPMAIDQQPLAIGMRAAMPFIDDFVPGHDPRAVAGLAKLIGARRPAARASPGAGVAGRRLSRAVARSYLVVASAVGERGPSLPVTLSLAATA